MKTRQLLYDAEMSAPQFVDCEKIGNVAVSVDEVDGYPTEVCLEITYNNAPRTWLSPQQARGLAEMLCAAAETIETKPEEKG